MRNLDIATLRSLQAVAEYGAVTRAAEALNMTQSALSMQIKRLEDVFDRPLLEKAGRGVVLSDFAQELLVDSRKLVAMNDALLMRHTGERPKGRLRIGLSSDWLVLHVPRAVRRFRADHPQIEVAVTDRRSKDLLAHFDRGEYDVILTTEFSCPDHAHHLFKIDLAWFGAVDGQAWLQRPLPMANSMGCAYRPIGMQALEAAGIEYVNVADSGGDDTGHMMTLADLGVNIHPREITLMGVEVIDHGGALPPLPQTWLNMYLTDGPAAQSARDFASYVRRTLCEAKEEMAGAKQAINAA